MEPHTAMRVVHEKTDADTPAVLRVLLGLLLVTAVVALGLVYLTKGLVAVERAGDPPRAPLAHEPGRLPPEPRLQMQPFADIELQRAEEQGLLTSYGWVDEKAGVVRIPIDEAKALLLKRGLPVAGGDRPSPPPVAGSQP